MADPTGLPSLQTNSSPLGPHRRPRVLGILGEWAASYERVTPVLSRAVGELCRKERAAKGRHHHQACVEGFDEVGVAWDGLGGAWGCCGPPCRGTSLTRKLRPSRTPP